MRKHSLQRFLLDAGTVRYVLLLVTAATLAACSDKIELGSGARAPLPPRQIEGDGEVLLRAGFTLTPRAEFEVLAKLLSKRRYRWDNLAALVPWDFALGWGPMSDEAVLSGTRVTQGDRFMFWHLYDRPLNIELVERSSANMHLIPADASVLAVMNAAPEGAILSVRGQLVDVVFPDGEQLLATSLSRTDRGAGACEILYVRGISVLDAG